MYLQRHWFTKNRFTNFLSLLLILASLSSQGQAPGLVVNEVSQGSTAAREFAELVVVGPPCTTVDLRGWIIDDNNGEFVDCAGPGNGALSGCGIAGGHIRFKNDPVWSAVPVGTILLVYAFDPGDPGAQAEIGPLTPDYTDQNCDFVRVVPVNASNTFMEMELNLPHSPTPGTACPANRTCPNGSTGDPGYGPATYVPLDNQSFSGFGRLGLRNEGDAFQTRQPNGAFFHGISYGSSDPDCLGAAMPTLNGGPDGTHINDSGSNKTYQFSNTVSDDYRQPLNFISATAASDQSPGRPNNCANAQWIASLRRPPESYFSNGSACQNPTAAPVSICAGQQTTLSVPLNTGPCNSDSYSWMISGSGAVNIIGAVGGTTLTIEGVSAGAMTIVVTATLNHALLAAQGGCAIPPSTATYTFPVTVSNGPPASSTSLTGCAGSNGQAVFDLTSVDQIINLGLGNTVSWFLNGTATNPIPDPTAFSSGTTTVFAQVSDGSGCQSPVVPVPLNVFPAPPAFPAELYGCDQGGGQSTFDLTLANMAVNGGSGLAVDFWLDPAATQAVANPGAFSSPTSVVYATTSAGGCPSAPVPVNLWVTPAPNSANSFIAVDPTVACGPTLVSVQFFFPHPTAAYDLSLLYGNAMSGFQVYNATGVQSGQVAQFNISETTDFQLVGVGLTGNPACDAIFANPITLTVNIADAPILVVNGLLEICAGDAIDLSAFVEETGNPPGAIPITFHSGSPATGGNQIDPVVSPGATTTYYAFADAGGGCTAEIPVTVTVMPAGTPVLGSASLCSNDLPLDLGTLLDPAFPDGTWSGPGVSGDTFDPSGLSGQINLAFTSSEPCIEVANTTVGVSSGPEVINLTTDCAPDNLTYTVSFELIGGDPATYTIDGQPLGGTIFTSGPIEGGTPYSFEIDDDSGCGPQTVSGVLDCFCLSYAGTMDVASGPIVLCSSGNFDVAPFFNNDEFVGPDDALQFVLHSDPGNQLGVVYAVSNSGMFNTSVIPGNQAYASVIVGDDLGGGIDLDDPCLSVAAGIEIWVDELAFMPGPSQTGCEGDCFAWPVSFSGLPPFLVNVIVENGTTVDFGTLVSYTNDTIFHICAADYGLSTGTLTLTPLEMFDAECILIFNVPYTPVDFTWEKPPASDLLMTLCAGESLIVNGTTYDENNPSGTEILTGASSLGCDSILNVQLNFLPAADGQLFVELCDGESITVNGALYDQSNPSGTEIFPNAAANGCDSILQVQLSFLPAADGQLFAGLCNGESVTVNGTLYDQSNPSGTEIFPNAAVNGCDSVLQVQLSFLPTASGQLLETLCQGESITVNGTTYDQNNPSGTEILTNAAANGCDSILQVQLSFLPAVNGPLIAELLFPGDSIVVNGTVYNQANPSGTEIFAGAAANGCDSIVTISLTFEDIYIGATGISPACFRGEDGLIVIDTLIGGKPPYSVALGSNDFEPIAGFPVTLGGLGSGDYDLWIEDADGFTYVLEVTISDPPALVLELGPDRTLPLGESVEFEPLLNFVPAALQWAPSAFLSCDTCLNPLASPLEDITYTLTAIDPLGCLTSDQISLRVYRQRALYAPNAFSPDFDGVNDLFTIFAGAEVAEIRNLQIFNRWGDQVFQAPLIPLNDESWGWDGTFRGQRLDADVFVYYAEVEYIDGQRELIKGDVLLIR